MVKLGSEAIKTGFCGGIGVCKGAHWERAGLIGWLPGKGNSYAWDLPAPGWSRLVTYPQYLTCLIWCCSLALE